MTDRTMTKTSKDEMMDVDDAMDLEDEISELKKEKRDKLKSEEESTEKKEATGKYGKGYIESLTKTDDNVLLDVEYYRDGEFHEKRFTLDRPKEPEDISLDSDLIRLRKVVNLDNRQTLLKEEVPLRFDKKDVRLDIPDDVKGLNYQKYKARRRFDTESNIIGQLKESVSATLGIVGVLLGINILITFLMTVGAKFVVDLLISGMVLFFVAIIMSAIEEGVLERDKPHLTVGTLFGLSLIVGIVALFTSLPTVWIESQYTLYQNGMTVVQLMATVVLFMVSGSKVKKIGDSLYKKSVEKYNNLKKKWQMRKGVEYVRE